MQVSDHILLQCANNIANQVQRVDIRIARQLFYLGNLLDTILE